MHLTYLSYYFEIFVLDIMYHKQTIISLDISHIDTAFRKKWKWKTCKWKTWESLEPLKKGKNNGMEPIFKIVTKGEVGKGDQEVQTFSYKISHGDGM